jgi:hypothetical protein
LEIDGGNYLTEKRVNKYFPWLGWILLVLVIFAAGSFFLWQQALPVKLVSHYSGELLWEEVSQMHECAECHEAEAFHRCSTCHDDHGAVEFSELPFFAMIEVTGDVPNPGFVQINEILPYRDQPHTMLPLQVFLENQGVEEFESVSLTSRDGGFITIPEQNLNERALLLPFSDGIRFASEDLHVSTWLKGLTGMIVVGDQLPLTINGEATSIGRLLLGPTRQVTVEPARVMFVSEQDGEIRDAQTASQVRGAALEDLLGGDLERGIVVKDQDGVEHEYTESELAGAVLTPGRNGTTLVIPDLARGDWIDGVVELRTK